MAAIILSWTIPLAFLAFLTFGFSTLGKSWANYWVCLAAIYLAALLFTISGLTVPFLESMGTPFATDDFADNSKGRGSAVIFAFAWNAINAAGKWPCTALLLGFAAWLWWMARTGNWVANVRDMHRRDEAKRS